LKNLLKALLLSLAICLPAKAANDYHSERFFDNTGGLLDRVSPLLVPSKNASALSNVTLNNRGQLKKRNGYTALNTGGALGDAGNGRYVTGGGYHDASTGTDFFAVIAGTNVYRTANTFGTTYGTVTGTITITASATNLAQTTSLNDKLIFCNESDKPFYLSASGNALAISTPLFSGATTCTTNSNYLLVANTTESAVVFPTRVRWSDINNQNSFPANNYVDIEPNSGDKIVAIVNFEDKVYVFKKRAVFQLLVTGQDGASAFIVRPLSRNIGAWAKNSVKVIPNVGVVFLAQNTVYTLSDAGLEPIGDSIQTTLDSVTRSQWKNSIGEVYPKRFQYWLAVSLDANEPELTLVYDYIQKAWTTYDLNTDTLMLAQAEDSNGDNILLMGDASGWVYKQDTGTADYPANVKTAISSSYTSGDLTFNNPDIRKNFKYFYLYSSATSSTTVSVETAYDYGVTFDNPITIDIGNVGAVYGSAVYGTSTYGSVVAVISRIELNSSARSVKFRISNNGMDSGLDVIGWTVVYRLEDFTD
jgi:hypothetical protein